MKNKKSLLKLSASIALAASLSTCAYASTVTKAAPSEQGWRFGKFDETNSTTPKTEKEILARMLKVEEEQLKTQKQILKVLNDQYNPKPETIMVDGKPCIANSSAKCYKWEPVLEAKKYPVIAEFYSNPTEENAAKYLQWYSKHMNHAKKAGVALTLAKYQYGDNATDFNIDKTGTIGAFGANSSGEEEHLKKMFREHMSDFYINVYLGRGLDADIFGLEGYDGLFEEFPKLTVNVVYYNNDVKTKLNALSKDFHQIRMLQAHTRQEAVSSDMFKQNGIYATPTSQVVLKSDGSSQILYIGKMGSLGFAKKVIQFLWFRGIIKSNNYASDYKKWDDSKYIKYNKFEEYGTRKDFSKYQYHNTDMKPLEVPTKEEE